ncbi:hypothetical protein Cgig2_030808 [Carnegiea gigantea]|uniref:Uncharacterized protein n=1 Tax=Carnegiea gigantea TaxID=171969 RepID=A0A9Q1KUN6_9CARY|nr:hypothetical protein Cgig2_030808 [Carnegiea gigantea]
MAGMELQNTVKEAINALYHHLDDACRMQADRWLQEFQRTIDAWQPSLLLLWEATREKIIGKALLLDEIINYVQSLQQHSQLVTFRPSSFSLKATSIVCQSVHQTAKRSELAFVDFYMLLESRLFNDSTVSECLTLGGFLSFESSEIPFEAAVNGLLSVLPTVALADQKIISERTKI